MIQISLYIRCKWSIYSGQIKFLLLSTNIYLAVLYALTMHVVCRLQSIILSRMKLFKNKKVITYQFIVVEVQNYVGSKKWFVHRKVLFFFEKVCTQDLENYLLFLKLKDLYVRIIQSFRHLFHLFNKTTRISHHFDYVAHYNTYLIGEIMLVYLGIIFHIRKRSFQRKKVYG